MSERMPDSGHDNDPGRDLAEPPISCTCGIRSLDPLRHGWDCPVRTVFHDPVFNTEDKDAR